VNDAPRIYLGVLASVASWVTLEKGAVLAALCASLATAVFMTLSAVEKWRALRAARAVQAAPTPPPPAAAPAE
jgi:hypothetical protein